jgi:archaellum component FlaF (FlaF/FlaG flagellin family)
VSFTTSIPRSELTIDGEFAGQAPIYNRYMNYGRHKVQAVNDRYEGTEEFVILATDSLNKVVSVDMRDMSDHFGKVTLTVDNDAEIYFNGRMVGAGTWKTELREGVYQVETRAPDCDPVKSSFTVVAQQENEIKATPPTPYTGYLSIFTRPATATAVYNGTHALTLQESNILPIGTYQVELSRKGYLTETHEYTVTRNETTSDTITMKRIKYVKPNTFYFGGAYTLRTLAGASGIVGMVIYNNDLQLSYTLGLTKSKPTYWYNNTANGAYQSSVTYKMSSMAAKYGFQINLMNKFAITPQVGLSIDKLSATVSDGSVAYGDKATCACITLGVKLLLVPFQHCYLFAAPEIDIANKKGGDYERIAEACNVSAGGFVANFGLLINF